MSAGDIIAFVSTIIAGIVAITGGLLYYFTKNPPKKQIITIIACALIFVILFGLTVFFIPRLSTSTFIVSPTPLSTSMSSPSVNTSTPFTFDFETDTPQWHVSEEHYKPTQVRIVTNPVHSGTHALEVSGDLLGDASPGYTSNKEVYQHTEATVYFNQVTLKGFNTPGPYNLTNKQVSCFVYLPGTKDPGTGPQASIKIFVKSLVGNTYPNDSGKEVLIDSNHVGNWFQLSFIVGAAKEDADTTFDATKVVALGIRIATTPGSTLQHTGPVFYVDDCAIQH